MNQLDMLSDLTKNGERVQALSTVDPFRIDYPPSESGLRPKPLHVLLTSVSSDAHTWNLVFMQLLLEHMGHAVSNLGACVPVDEVVQACSEQHPDLLVVSTVNGHGNIDGERLINSIRKVPALLNLPVVIGGKLGIRGSQNASYADDLLRAGFTAVFDADTSLLRFEDFVKQVSANNQRAAALEAA